MALLDEEVLTTLLHESGDSFDIPATGVAELLRRARQDDEEPAGAVPAPRLGTDGRKTQHAPIRAASSTLTRTIRSHRLLSVAASLILVLAIAGAAVLSGSRTPATRATTGLKTALGATSSSAVRGTSATATRPSTSKATGSGAPHGSPALPHGSAAANGVTPTLTPPTLTPQTPTPPLPSGEVGGSARIEQRGSLGLTVATGDLSATMSKLSTLATTYGGFVANSQTQSGASGGAPSGSVTLEIPVASFSAVLNDTQSFGRVSHLATKATDVTGQYVDLQAQITALEASRQQYLTIMAKASSIGDVLAVQEQLDTLQSQIQQLEGQLEVLTNETDYSTLTVTVSAAESVHHRHPPRTTSGLAKAWHDSVHGFVGGLESLIRIAGPTLFVLLCVGALVLGSRLLWRRLQRHNL